MKQIKDVEAPGYRLMNFQSISQNHDSKDDNGSKTHFMSLENQEKMRKDNVSPLEYL